MTEHDDIRPVAYWRIEATLGALCGVIILEGAAMVLLFTAVPSPLALSVPVLVLLLAALSAGLYFAWRRIWRL